MSLKKNSSKEHNVQNGYSFRQKMKKNEIRFVNRLPFRYYTIIFNLLMIILIKTSYNILAFCPKILFFLIKCMGFHRLKHSETFFPLILKTHGLLVKNMKNFSTLLLCLKRRQQKQKISKKS